MSNEAGSSAAGDDARTVLILCLSVLKTDPRVIREIEWLAGDGWIVDTIGLGPLPSDSVRNHFELSEEPAWTRPRPIRGALLLSPHSIRFRTLLESRIPRQADRLAREGSYDLVVVNDIDFLPWARRIGAVGHVPRTHVHLDLHEYYTRALPEGTALPLLMNSYNRWLRKFIASPAFATRTTVAEGIAEIYHEEFGIEAPRVVRNAPAFVAREPSEVDPNRIELIYHGHAAWERGLRQITDAIPLLDQRFVVRLMLTGDPAVKDELIALTEHLGDRVIYSPAVPMQDVATAINSSDLEVMLFPPDNPNLQFALPNKLFEAIQGRLGLVVGASPSMTDIIEEFGNGVVVNGWTATDLAATINSLSAEDVIRLKLASDACAAKLNSEKEGEAFVASLSLEG